MRVRGAAGAGASALVLAGAVVLAGCTGDDPEPTPTTSSSAPTSSTAEPTTSEPTVAVPELPAEASEATAAGAEAWVQHWIDLLNYAKRTGDTSPLSELSGSECNVCASTISEIDRVYEDEGQIEGGEMVASRLLSSPPDADDLVSVGVTFTEGAASEIYPSADPTPVAATPPTDVAFVMVFEGQAWRLRGIGTA